MFGYSSKKIKNEVPSLTTARSAVLYYYNDEHEKIIVAITALAFLNDKILAKFVDRLINDLEQPADTKMYVAIEGTEYRVY